MADRHALPDDDRASLNAHQRRSLEVTLRMLEEAVDDIHRTLEATPISGVLYQLENPYSVAERNEIRKLTEEVRRILHECRERWGLQTEFKTLDAIVRSKMTVLWADLSDCLSSKLRRYGPVPDAAQREVDERVGQLIRIVWRFGLRADVATDDGGR